LWTPKRKTGLSAHKGAAGLHPWNESMKAAVKHMLLFANLPFAG